MIIGFTNKMKSMSAHPFRSPGQNMEVLILSSGALHHIFSSQFERDSRFRLKFNFYFSYLNQNK